MQAPDNQLPNNMSLTDQLYCFNDSFICEIAVVVDNAFQNKKIKSVCISLVANKVERVIFHFRYNTLYLSPVWNHTQRTTTD